MLWLILACLAFLALFFVLTARQEAPRIAVPEVPPPPATKGDAPLGVPGHVVEAIYSVVEGQDATFPEATLADIPTDQEQRYILTTLTKRMSDGTGCSFEPGQVMKARKETSTGGRAVYTMVCLVHERTTSVTVRLSLRVQVSRERPEPRCIGIRFDPLTGEPTSNEPERIGSVPYGEPVEI